MQVTLMLAVRNEEKRIGNFLKTHAPFVDDIVLVHDGKCLDRTMEIAAAYPVRAFVRPGEHNPHPHREWALRCAIEGGWVAMFEPDETLSPNLCSDLRAIVQDADARGLDGLAVNQVPYLDGVALRHHLSWKIFKHSDHVHYPLHPHGGIEGLLKGEALAPTYYYTHYQLSAELPSKFRRRNAHLRRCINREPNSARRSAWEQGMQLSEEMAKLLAEKNIVLDEPGFPLVEATRMSHRSAMILADRIGVVTVEEMRWADVDYIARTLGLAPRVVSKWQQSCIEILKKEETQ